MPTPTVQADARQRSKRTFIQGILIDVGVAVAAALLVWLPDADLSSTDAWIIFGTSLAKTVLQTLAAYVMRLKVAPDQP